MALGADLTAHAPPARIPKLKYRNPLPAGEQSLAPEPPRHPEILPANPQEPPASPSSGAASSNYPPSFETASLTSPSLASTRSSAESSNDSKSSKKKKKASSVLGFLTLKEPSQVALEQYADAQRKHAAGRGGASVSSSQASASFPQKLPKNVPKVNSKWDGVPQSAKNRYAGSTASSKDRRSLSSSQGSQFSALSWNGSKFSVMTDGTRNPPNSIASPATSMSHLAIREEPQPVQASSSSADLPEMSYYFPEPLGGTGAVQAVPFRPDMYHQLMAAEAPTRASEPTFESTLLSDELVGCRPDSPASSTDSGDTIVRDTADVIFKKLNDRPHKSFWGDAPAVQSPDENVPESHDFLFGDQLVPEVSKAGSPMTTPPIQPHSPARPIQNFSRPRSSSSSAPSTRSAATSSYRTTPRSSALPTLYEASLASTESKVSFDTVQGDEDDDAYSIAPSTNAPSELSAHWHESPRERLGLGGRLRLNDVLPWDSQRNMPGKPKKSRFSMFMRT